MAQQTRYQILEALRKGEGGTVSGGELAQTLGVSRTAVWKAVTTLQNEGYRIESVPNKGYRLLESEVYSGYEVERRLTTKVVGRPLIFLEEVNSTNDYVKALAAETAPLSWPDGRRRGRDGWAAGSSPRRRKASISPFCCGRIFRSGRSIGSPC